MDDTYIFNVCFKTVNISFKICGCFGVGRSTYTHTHIKHMTDTVCWLSCLHVFLSAVTPASFQRWLLTQHATGQYTWLTKSSFRVCVCVCVYADDSVSACFVSGGSKAPRHFISNVWLVWVHVFAVVRPWMCTQRLLSSWVSGLPAWERTKDGLTPVESLFTGPLMVSLVQKRSQTLLKVAVSGVHADVPRVKGPPGSPSYLI